ncbi:unnamed protein product [Prorocentrum cordatum]|uniref:Apple domain-containing protein n=1 Tax=Prorocentrum cordatum TaxID=2364126 RepID=A0ABN9U843_9DINO|nr:unnamed protein product [Polarella glacialis]
MQPARDAAPGLYASVDGEDAGAAAASAAGRPKAWTVAALIAGTAAVAGTAAWLGAGRGGHELRVAPQAAAPLGLQEVSAPGGTLVPGVEYNLDGGWFQSMDHIPTAVLCQTLCQGEPKCNYFTWVEDAGLDGCPSQCWLKGGELKYEAPKAGVTSGTPAPRRTLPAIDAPAGGATLYCWVLSAAQGEEPAMLDWQAKKKVGPFQCDKAQVYSNQAVEIGGMTAAVIDSDMKCEYGGDSQSALNTWIFIAAWEKVFQLGDYALYEWTVKVDADAVFFPNRLKSILANHAGAAYLSNCQYGLHGPIEVFSKAALDALSADYQRAFDKKSPATCVNGLEFGEYGEDMFIDQCLGKVLGVGAPALEPLLICEDHCDCPEYYACPASDSYRVTFHPFKSVGAYENCMGTALNGPIATAGADDDDDDEAVVATDDGAAYSDAAAAAYGEE